LKREINSDAAIFRRGFYSCREERHDDVSENAEMFRKTSPKSETVSKKEKFLKRRFRKKAKLIKKAIAEERMTRVVMAVVTIVARSESSALS